jgi:flagella basal body P-ring formation protein FlgA
MAHKTLAAGLVLALATAAHAAADVDPDPLVRAAIMRAVSARMGGDARVSLERLESSPLPAEVAALRAVPPPGARTGRLVSFSLFAGERRVGTATALVRVTVPHLRAVSRVARDTALTAAHVVAADEPVDGVRLVRLPGLVEAVGSLARRDVEAGEALTHAVLEVRPAVRSGDEVEVISRVGVVEARGTGRASGSGYVGGRVRVTTSGRKTLRAARVVSAGVVELLNTVERIQGEKR